MTLEGDRSVDGSVLPIRYDSWAQANVRCLASCLLLTIDSTSPVPTWNQTLFKSLYYMPLFEGPAAYCSSQGRAAAYCCDRLGKK